MTTSRQRFINIGGTMYRYLDATRSLGLIVTDAAMATSKKMLNVLDAEIIKRRKKGLPTQHLEEQRSEVCIIACALTAAGYKYVRVLSRTTLVLQPDEKGELVVMRYVHGASTSRFIHNVDRKIPVHGQPLELSPPTHCRQMDVHAAYAKASDDRLRKKRKNKPRTKRAPVEIGAAFLRGGAHSVKRNLSYAPKPAGEPKPTRRKAA